jgi:hypothetical protein
MINTPRAASLSSDEIVGFFIPFDIRITIKAVKPLTIAIAIAMPNCKNRDRNAPLHSYLIEK